MQGQGYGFGFVVFAVDFNQRATGAVGLAERIFLGLPVVKHAPNLPNVFVAALGARDGVSVDVEHPQIHQPHGLPVNGHGVKSDK